MKFRVWVFKFLKVRSRFWGFFEIKKVLWVLKYLKRFGVKAFETIFGMGFFFGVRRF